MLLYWVWYAELKGISLLQKHRLLAHFHDPEEIYHTSDKVFERLGLAEKLRQALREKDLQDAEKILRSCSQKHIGLLPLTDTAYPERLRNTPDAPLLLYYRGTLPDWDSVPLIGMVGTRRATAYGLQVAHQLGGEIAASGGLVVSGGAEGNDAAAMWGALDAGSSVVGVLGSGVDIYYPYKNRKLFEATVKHGCLLSEYPPGTTGQPWHFPARNRIISGISNGVLVTEAPARSGALITADRALEQGRDVFVVPGNINTFTCKGSNGLLQQGATPVFTGWDVLSCYESLYPGKLCKRTFQPITAREPVLTKVAQTGIIPKKNSENSEMARKIPIDNGQISTYSVLENKKPVLNQEEQAVMAQLTREPQEPAELIAKLDMPSGKVLSVITMLTVKGLVQKHPGGRISLK